MHRSLTTTALAGAALVFAACGGGDSISENLAEEAIEQAGGGDVDIDSDGGSVNIDTDEGSMSVDEDGNVEIETEDGSFSSSGDIPEGFPDEVPLPDGLDVGSGAVTDGPEGESYQVAGSVDGDPADVFAELIAQFEDAGFDKESEANNTSGGSFFGNAGFTDGTWTVNVSVTDGVEGEGAAVTLLVVPAPA